MYYFAYGSNMNFQRMKQKCPNSRFVGPVFLRNYRFIYDGLSTTSDGGAANIVKTDNENDEVWGGLYEISERDLSAIQGPLATSIPYVKTTDGYVKHELEVNAENKTRFSAIVYLRTGEKQNPPSKDYRKAVIEGARSCMLPEKYIKGNL